MSAERLLAMLADAYPYGIKQRDLIAKHKFTPAVLYSCLQNNWVRVTSEFIDQEFSYGMVTVFQFHITAEGRKHLGEKK